MLESDLRHRVQMDDRPDGRSTTIRLRDAFLNFAFSDQLKCALFELVRERLSRGVRDFVFDLTRVNIMDSCGLSVLIGVRRLVEAACGRVILVITSPIVVRLFTITRLDGVFRIVNDEVAAAALLAEPAPVRAQA